MNGEFLFFVRFLTDGEFLQITIVPFTFLQFVFLYHFLMQVT